MSAPSGNSGANNNGQQPNKNVNRNKNVKRDPLVPQKVENSEKKTVSEDVEKLIGSIISNVNMNDNRSQINRRRKPLESPSKDGLSSVPMKKIRGNLVDNKGINQNNQNNQSNRGNNNSKPVQVRESNGKNNSNNDRGNNGNNKLNNNNNNNNSKPVQVRESNGKSEKKESVKEGKLEMVQDGAIPMSDERYADADIHPLIKKAIVEGLKFEFMTPIQSLITKKLGKNKDCFGQARTGTGKTIAFLIPVIESIIEMDSKDSNSIQCLILSPTRELAIQIAKDAANLTKFLPNIVTQIVIGGTNINSESNKLQGKCNILVATPGRLNDHMSDARFTRKLSSVRCLVLDEADRLMDQGFWNEILKITNQLPKKEVRQTLLFSATLGNQVKQMISSVLKQDYEIFKTIAEGEGETHETVPQSVFNIPFSQQIAAVLSILRIAFKNEEKEYPLKAVVFATTARGTEFVYEVLKKVQESGGLSDSIELCTVQSRMNQGARTKNNQNFTKCVRGVLVSSDVSARGVDFPKVTHVLQIGQPSNEDQYVHRLGRTGRAGREGEGVLLLDPLEMKFKDRLIAKKGIQFKEVNHESEVVEDITKVSVDLVKKAAAKVEPKLKGQVFSAWIGYNKPFHNPQTVVTLANQYSKEVLGCANPPAVTSQFIGKSGLKSVSHMFTIDNSIKQKNRQFQKK